MTPPPLVRADFVTGIVLALLGLATLLLSLDMPRFEDRNVNPYTVPGLVPGALGLIILVLGAILATRAARAGGWRLGPAGSAAAGDERRRVWLTLALTLGYAAGLVGRMPFWLATFLFAFGFVALFEWAKGPDGRVRRLASGAVYAGLLSAVVTYVFQEIFLVRLP